MTFECTTCGKRNMSKVQLCNHFWKVHPGMSPRGKREQSLGEQAVDRAYERNRERE